MKLRILFLLLLLPLLTAGYCNHVSGKFTLPPIHGDHWFNSPPLSPAQLAGKVVLVDFWEYTCINCQRTLPYVKSWHERYHDQGLVIIGVHTPEFEFGKKVENISRAVKELGIKYPVVMDNEYEIWNTFNNSYWPRKYLFDAKGKLRYDHAGEGEYAETEAQIQKLLHELHPSAHFTKPLKALTREDTPGAVCYPATAELYAGYVRGRLGNREGYKPEQTVNFKDPGNHLDGLIYANGPWVNERQALRHAQPSGELNDYILIKYHAIEVNAVMKPEGEPKFRVVVLQDGKPLAQDDKGEDIRYDEHGQSYVQVDEPRMYRIAYNKKYGKHELKLTSTSPGFALYSYTFGACAIPK